jgi:hypothetical protein
MRKECGRNDSLVLGYKAVPLDNPDPDDSRQSSELIFKGRNVLKEILLDIPTFEDTTLSRNVVIPLPDATRFSRTMEYISFGGVFHCAFCIGGQIIQPQSAVAHRVAK